MSEDRFKFRAWDRSEEKMLYDINLDSGGKAFIWNVYEDLVSLDCDLMQCTGLKDKNGKLIYEGDIMIFREGQRIVPGEYFIVAWSDKESRFYPSGLYCDQHTEPRRLIPNEDTIICGNIYENPELLKK